MSDGYLKVAAVGRGRARRVLQDHAAWRRSRSLGSLGPSHVTDLGRDFLLVARGGLDEFHPLVAGRALDSPARLAEGRRCSNIMRRDADFGVEQ